VSLVTTLTIVIRAKKLVYVYKFIFVLLLFICRDEDFLLQAAAFFDMDSTVEGCDSSSCCKLVVITDGSKGSTVLFPHGDCSVMEETELLTTTFQDLMYLDNGGPKPGSSGVNSDLKACCDTILSKHILDVNYNWLMSIDGSRNFAVIR
jgi:hypothetical protein